MLTGLFGRLISWRSRNSWSFSCKNIVQKYFLDVLYKTRVNESRGNNLLLLGASPGNAINERIDMFLQVEETQLSRCYKKHSRTCTSSFLMYSFLPFCLRSTLRSNFTSRIFFVTSAKHIVKYLVEILCMMKITVLFWSVHVRRQPRSCRSCHRWAVGQQRVSCPQAAPTTS